MTFYTLMVGAVIALRLKAPRPEPALPDVGYPLPGPDLHRPGGLAGARLHLPQAQDLGNRLPDRPGGHPGLPDLVADRRPRPNRTSRANEPKPH